MRRMPTNQTVKDPGEAKRHSTCFNVVREMLQLKPHKLLQDADEREQRTAERVAERETERDAAIATASTVSGSRGSGGNMDHFTYRLMQNTLFASRIELKG